MEKNKTNFDSLVISNKANKNRLKIFNSKKSIENLILIDPKTFLQRESEISKEMINKLVFLKDFYNLI